MVVSGGDPCPRGNVFVRVACAFFCFVVLLAVVMPLLPDNLHFHLQRHNSGAVFLPAGLTIPFLIIDRGRQ